MKKYRLALIGCGDIAETGHVPSLLAHPRFELAVVCDVRRERAQLLADQAGGVSWCTDYHELLDRADLDAALLALPPEYSVDVAIDFLTAGKPALDEKPLATSLEAGRKLAAEVERTRGVYQIGFVFRYSALVGRLAGIARQIGTPALYEIGIYDERRDPGNPSHFARINGFLKTSSAITHEGSHPIDYFTLWNPSPFVRVSAAATRTAADLLGPNAWSATLEAADSSILQLNITWLTPELPSSYMRIIGPRGALQLDLASAMGTLHQAGRAETVGFPRLAQNWKGQLDTFASAIDQGKAGTATVQDGLRALAATQACETAAASHQTVQI